MLGGGRYVRYRIVLRMHRAATTSVSVLGSYGGVLGSECRVMKTSDTRAV